MSSAFVNPANVKCKVWKVEINIVFYEIHYLCRKWEKICLKKQNRVQELQSQLNAEIKTHQQAREQLLTSTRDVDSVQLRVSVVGFLKFSAVKPSVTRTKV